MVLVIDNYDSFTYNLVQYLGEMIEVNVKRNDKITPGEVEKMSPTHIIISPGPGRPEKAGISNELISYFKDKIPILGVCLGHQCIGQVFGGEIVQADNIYHGKVSSVKIIDDNNQLFAEVENPFTATRYHSLIIENDSIPPVLRVLARTEKEEIMAIKHRDFPIFGVQFHPESILTENGKQILGNFIGLR